MAVTPQQGTLLQHGISTVFTTIAQRVSIDGPELSRAAVKTSDLDTTVAHTFRPSQLYDGGELSMTLNYDGKSATHILLTGLFATQAIDPWKLILADGTTALLGSAFGFNGFLTKFKPGQMEEGDENNVTAEVTLKVSGPVTFTPGT